MIRSLSNPLIKLIYIIKMNFSSGKLTKYPFIPVTFSPLAVEVIGIELPSCFKPIDRVVEARDAVSRLRRGAEVLLLLTK